MRNDIDKPAIFSGISKSLLPLPLLSLLISCGVTDGAGSGVNPGIDDLPIAYVKRVIPLDDDGFQEQPDLREPLLSMPGGDLFLRSSTSSDATETNITFPVTNGLGDVKDVDVSADGKKLIFSLQLEDPNPNDDEIPEWNIYTYDTELEVLSRVIISDVSAEKGDDLDPFFLADGRIVFTSNRQSQSREILLNEVLEHTKPQFQSNAEDNRTKALVLHVMNSDGSGIKQISFNQSHDLDPALLNDGRILFTRWDRINDRNAMSLYTVYPDGTGLQLYYGAHDESHQDAASNTVQFMQPRELIDGRVMVLSQPYTNTFAGGQISIIDAQNYVDIRQPTDANKNVLSGPAMVNATATNVILDGSISLEGRFASFYPLNDGKRMLVSKGLCQVGVDNSPDPMVPDLDINFCFGDNLTAPGATEVFPSYGVWAYDRSNFTESLIVMADPGMMISEVVALKPYDNPVVLPVKSVDDDLKSENVGILKIRSVYDFAGVFDGCFFGVCYQPGTVTSPLSLGDPMVATADQRPARFIRIVKAVGIPNRNDTGLPRPNNNAFGPLRRLGMKEILGYKEIQPDGSVMVKVPANVAFYFDVLDKDARRIGPRHDNWLKVNPGGTIECSGCHSHAAARPLPHGRTDAEPTSSNVGAPSDGFEYPNTLNAIRMEPYNATLGQTMAEALVHNQARDLITTALTLTMDVDYTDIWTDPAARTPDVQFSYSYSDKTMLPSGLFMQGLTTQKPFPVSSTCETSWEANCRIVINYRDHIQPIWDAARLDAITNADVQCVSCHTYGDPAAPTLPSAQLNLTMGTLITPNSSDEEMQHYESYRELVFDDELKVINGTSADNVLVPDVDANGDPILVTVDVERSISTNGARSSYFMEKMTETELDAPRTLTPATVNHANMLTPAELRLISEWIDIGAQYHNNPFHPLVPIN